MPMLPTAGQSAGDKYEFVLKTDKESGIYDKGDTVVFSVALLKNGSLCGGVKYTCQFTENGFRKEKKEFVSDGKILTLSKKFTGQTLWYAVKAEISPGQPGVPETVCGELGAIASPYEITPAADEPEDFDAFWKKQREELDRIPVETLEKTAVPPDGEYDDKVLCFDVKIRCAGDKPVSGYLCMPKNAGPKSLPALVTFQGAGVLGAWKQPEFGEKAVVLNINAHGIENGKPDRFYRDLRLGEGALDDYAGYGAGDRDTYYYKGVYTRVMRALDYVKTLPEWDGKNLLVYGASQGGCQSIAAAALDRQVTYCNAGVPALCDHSAAYAGRTPGWPMLAAVRKEELDDGKRALMKNLRFYDTAYFAGRVRCGISVSAGLLDFTCSPTSVMAAYNSIPAGVKKSILIRPAGTHGSASEGMLQRFHELLEAVKKGKDRD